MRRDPYEVLGVAARRRRRRDQEDVPPARARAAPGREPPRPGGRGEVQGGRRGVRDPLRRRAARDLRPLRLRGARLARVRVAGARLRLVRRHLRRVLRRRSVRRRSGGGGGGRDPGRRHRRGGGDLAGRGGDAARRPRSPTSWSTRCEHCHGNGAEPGTPIETCPTLRRHRPGPRGDPHGVRAARARAGLRHLRRRRADPAEPCAECGGPRPRARCGRRSRWTSPPGSRTSSASGWPAAATPASAAARPGDLYVLVRVAEDERFLRDGGNLVTVVDVPAPAAALGTTVTRADAGRRGGDRGRRRHAAGHRGDAARARDAADRARPPRRPAGGPQRGGAAQAERDASASCSRSCATP